MRVKKYRKKKAMLGIKPEDDFESMGRLHMAEEIKGSVVRADKFPRAPAPIFAALTSLAVVRLEQARLYRMLFKKNERLSSGDWERARKILIDIRDTLLAEAGHVVPHLHHTSNTTNNTLVVSGGLQRTDELLKRFANDGALAPHAPPVQDGPVLPAAVRDEPPGHGAPVAVQEDQGS